MTLATHIVFAGALTRPVAAAHPALLFLIALASHYILDLIPHWDYQFRSVPKELREKPDIRTWNYQEAEFWKDMLRVALDASLGIGTLLFLLSPEIRDELFRTLLIAGGSTLPDFFQSLYFTRKAEFIKPLQRFHDFFHTQLRLSSYPVIGIPFQAAFFLLAVYIIL